MRIVAGIARGRRLKGPKDDGTRPMTDRAREALFSILGDRIPTARVLDLYAGTGALGLEALSRGAESAVFVESDRGAVEVLAANIAHVGLGGQVRRMPVERFLAGSGGDRFDLVFVDPPYPMSHTDVEGVLGALAGWVSPVATVVVHRRAGEAAPAAPWPLSDERRYGSTQLWLYRGHA